MVLAGAVVLHWKIALIMPTCLEKLTQVSLTFVRLWTKYYSECILLKSNFFLFRRFFFSWNFDYYLFLSVAALFKIAANFRQEKLAPYFLSRFFDRFRQQYLKFSLLDALRMKCSRLHNVCSQLLPCYFA